MSSLVERAKDAQADADLRATLDRTLRKLEKAKASRQELVDAVYRAAGDAAMIMRPPTIKVPKPTGKGSPEVAILTLADWQMGKRTPSYGSDIAVKRVRRYAELAARLIVQNRAPVTEARVYLLGDLVEGETIFPGQAWRIDASLYRQLFTVADLLTEFVSTIAAVVPYVRVLGVIGNHGALGKRGEYHPETNVDAMAYNIARMRITAKHVDWRETLTDNERHWQSSDDVLGHTWFLFHGDQIKSASLGIPLYGYQKRLLGWFSSLDIPFRFATSGHFHVASRTVWNGITHWGAGSTESANTYAQEYLASGGQSPSQWLLFQGHRGMAAEHLLRLDEEDAA